jgi:prevent-host-death family protein
MKTVGLRELKNRLAFHVRQVRAGEAVAITDRGAVVAELTPPRRRDRARSGLEALARAGAATPARPLARADRAALYGGLARTLDSAAVAALLGAERGDR